MRYSIEAKAANRPVQLRAYADRVVVRFDGEVVATHERVFGRDRVRYNPLHYLPVLARKPGALRNGAPFKDWELPSNLTRLRARLGRSDEADRQFVGILAAIPEDGLDAVEDATARRRRPWRRRPSRSCASSQRPIAPVTTVCASSPRRSSVERHDLLALMTKLKLAGMRAAYDDIMRDGLKRQRSVQQILGDLLSAEVAEKQARSISYQIGAAKLPLAKELTEFEFTGSPVNEALCATCTAADSSRHSAMSYSSGEPSPIHNAHLAISLKVQG